MGSRPREHANHRNGRLAGLGRGKQLLAGQVLTLLGTIGSHLLPGGHTEGCLGVCGRTRARAQAEPRPGGTAKPDAGRRP